MDGSAPEQKIIHFADRRDVKLNQKVEGELKKMGQNVSTQPETQKHIPFTEELKQAGVDIAHVAGVTLEELASGEGGSTRDRVARENPISLVIERARRLRSSQMRKAA